MFNYFVHTQTHTKDESVDKLASKVDTSVDIKPRDVPTVAKSSALKSEIVLAENLSQDQTTTTTGAGQLKKRATVTHLTQIVASCTKVKIQLEFDLFKVCFPYMLLRWNTNMCEKRNKVLHLIEFQSIRNNLLLSLIERWMDKFHISMLDVLR